MEELFKNPLLGQRSDSGAVFETLDGVYFDMPEDIQNAPNPLAINLNGYDIKNSPFADNPIKNNKEEKEEKRENKKEDETPKKRLNDLDFNILQDSAVKKAQKEISSTSIFGKLLYRIFPKIYKGFLMKRALNKLRALNQTAKDLASSKTIPYGESDERYGALIEYLSSANTIHSRIMKKI